MARPLGGGAVGSAYFFGVMGIYVAFCGGLRIQAAKRLARGERWAWATTLANCACNFAIGVGAVAVGFRNPLIAVWLLACLLPAASAIVLHREYPVAAKPPAQS